MKQLFCIILVLFISTLVLSQNSPVNLTPVILNNYSTPQVVTRTIYSIDSHFIQGDTILFLQKNPQLAIFNVHVLNNHEIQFDVSIDSNFTDFSRHQVVVLDSSSQKKVFADLDFRYSQPPSIEKLIITQRGIRTFGELKLSGNFRTVAYLTLQGNGFFKTTNIEFDDPKIKVLNTSGWRIDNPPNELTVGLEIDGTDISIGKKRFRVKSDYSMETWGEILLQNFRPPQIISNIRSFVADGSERKIKIVGSNFFPETVAQLVPFEGFTKTKYISSNQLEVFVELPVLESNKSFRLALTNTDGQADTSGYFTVTAKPIGRARVKTVDQGSIFLGKKSRVIFAIDPKSGYRFSPNRSYEIRLEGDRFPVFFVLDDSTCEAIIKLEEEDTNRLLNQHVFSINEVNNPPRWKGSFTAKPAPKLYYMSPLRIIHPVDTLALVFKGKNLDKVSMYIEDPEIVFNITENRGDLLRVTAIAGKFVSPKSYPLELRIDGVPFIFQNFKIEVQPWQPFTEFIGIELSSFGFVTPSKLWRGSNIPRPIKASDAVNLKIFSNKIRAELGEQKIEISGVLMDSSNTIRAEAFDKRIMTIAKGTEILNWHWRVRERVRSGDRIEITLKNPGGQNKVTETFYVEPHWSEAFHGSTSFILFKIPFGGGEASTEIFRSMGIGISYQPVTNRNFLAFDASFILGNVAKADNNLSVEVGLGLSAILWSHLQIGIGSNLTGQSFNHGFTFVGTRFKLPVPW